MVSNFNLLSQESITLFLFQAVNRANEFARRSNSVESQNPDSSDQEVERRLQRLKAQNFDPWLELQFFNVQLGRNSEKFKPTSQKHEFDIGCITINRRGQAWDTEALDAYAFLQYFEECGLPFRIPVSHIRSCWNVAIKSAKGAASRIAGFYWRQATIVRAGDVESVDLLFKRKSLISYSSERADKQIEKFLGILNTARPNIVPNSETRTSVNWGDLLAQFTPEILSRLCCKCTYEKKTSLLDLLKDLYHDENKNKYSNINSLLQRILDSLSDSKKYKLIPKFLEFPFPENLDFSGKSEFLNPFQFFDIREPDSKANLSELDQKNVQKSFELAESQDPARRQWGICTLWGLYKLYQFSREQELRFGEILWSKTDTEYSLPMNTNLRNFAFLHLPHPRNKNPKKLIREYIKSAELPIQSEKEDPNSFEIWGDDTLLCREIVGADSSVDWATEEIEAIFSKLIQWWCKDKEYLNYSANGSFDIPKKFKNRFWHMRKVLCKVVIPSLKQDGDVGVQEIKRIISEFPNYGLPNVWLKVVSLHLFNENKNDLIEQIEQGLATNDDMHVVDSLDAILEFLRNKNSNDKEKPKLAEGKIRELLLVLGNSVRWKSQTELVPILNTVYQIIRDFPDLLSTKFKKRCLATLLDLATSTELHEELGDSAIAEKLNIRRKAAKLAFTLFKYYNEQREAVPGEVLRWKEICSSEVEFAEIRAEWDEPKT